MYPVDSVDRILNIAGQCLALVCFEPSYFYLGVSVGHVGRAVTVTMVQHGKEARLEAGGKGIEQYLYYPTERGKQKTLFRRSTTHVYL